MVQICCFEPLFNLQFSFVVIVTIKEEDKKLARRDSNLETTEADHGTYEGVDENNNTKVPLVDGHIPVPVDGDVPAPADGAH